MRLSRAPKRRAKPREDERAQLKAQWELNRRRCEEGWPPTPLDLEHLGGNLATLNTFDALGKPVTMGLRGKRMRIASGEIVRYTVELGNKVHRWQNKKEISGKDVMEILGIALMLTNDPAYRAARQAMIRHKLHTTGLKRAFSNLHSRHHEPPELSCLKRISRYLRLGYGFREAVEHVVAVYGIPGTSFSNAVDKVRKAYAKRKQLKAEQRRYLDGLGRVKNPQ